MKIKKVTVALICGLIMGLGPWVLLENPNVFWYPVSLAGGVLVAIVGYGAQMEQLGKGNTGEELLDEVLTAFKEKAMQLKNVFRRKSDL